MSPAQLLSHFDRINEAPDSIPRLRHFILDLAVRGKLVEQDPNDEPASELLKRIQGEKTRLVKEGKIKELKPLAITNTAKEIYKIPSSWKLVPLGETVNSHLGGGTPSKSNSTYWDGGILWASVKDVGKGKYIDETIDRITEAGLADSSSNLIPPGSLIVVTRMGLGKISINRVPIAINQDLRALSLSSLVSIDYHYIFFKTHDFEGTGLTVKGIKVEELLNIAFPLPPLAEQQRIVTKVDELMALCDRLEAGQTERESRRDRLAAASLHRLNNCADADAFRNHARFYFNHLPRLTTRHEHIQQLRQTILNLAVRGQLVPQDPKDEPAKSLIRRLDIDSVIYEPIGQAVNPPGWAWLQGSGVAEFVDPQPSHRTPAEYPNGIPYIGYSDIGNDNTLKFDGARRVSPAILTDHRKRYVLKNGDFVIGKIGTIGQPFFLPGPFNYTLSANLILVQPNLKVVVPSYLVTFFRSPIAETALRTQQTDSTHAVFGIKKARKFAIPIPPLAEQQRIVAKVDELMALCDRLEAQLTTTQTESRLLLESVLHHALSA